jgi:ferric-dicitrate binding protein FerR (iron transport regulator)
MSAPRRRPTPEPIDALVREMRDETRTPASVDWAAVDEKLFARIREAEAADAVGARTARVVWWPIAAALAVAAGVALVVASPRDTPPLDQSANESATALGADGARLVSGEGVTIDGHAAARGAMVHVGGVIETSSGRAELERPGKLTMWMEPSSKATVTRGGSALVVALEHGALEAQVVPVPEGEAFAVDVGLSRVAVHGTHLRVARDGDRVAVDLTEGIVSIGTPPRTGSTFGDLVTAPAHADFTSGDLASTLSVSHSPSSVRPAFAPVVVVDAPALVAPAPVATVATPVAVQPIAPKPSPSASASEARVEAPAIDPHAETTIANAVRACISAHPAENVTMTVSTVIGLDVGANGFATMARFTPPLAPDVQACAAAVVYKTRFEHAGAVSIPVRLTR